MPKSLAPARLLETLLRSIENLPPAQISKVEDAVATVRRRAEALVEIDAAGGQRPCPHCGGRHRSKWGSTRAGAQRWRCRDCGGTWTGRSMTPLGGVHRPDLFIEALRDMMGDAPRSCRKLARTLGISRHTAWRWRMTVIRSLPAERNDRLAGIVEADEAVQRESRKGSREWVRHAANSLAHPKPPRLRWRDYMKRTATTTVPPHGWRHWDKKLLAATDRSGHRVFEAIANATQKSISGALLPVMAPDVALCTDGHPTYEKIAKDEGITHFALIGGARSPLTPKTHHINTVNALIARFRIFMRPFCGPASQNLTAYGRWHAVRDNADQNYQGVFRHMLSSGRFANTIC